MLMDHGDTVDHGKDVIYPVLKDVVYPVLKLSQNDVPPLF